MENVTKTAWDNIRKISEDYRISIGKAKKKYWSEALKKAWRELIATVDLYTQNILEFPEVERMPLTSAEKLKLINEHVEELENELGSLYLRIAKLKGESSHLAESVKNSRNSIYSSNFRKFLKIFPQLDLRKKGEVFTKVGLSVTIEDADPDMSIVAIETLDGVMEFTLNVNWVNKTVESVCFTDPSGVRFAFELNIETGEETPIPLERREQNLLLFNWLREVLDWKGAL